MHSVKIDCSLTVTEERHMGNSAGLGLAFPLVLF